LELSRLPPVRIAGASDHTRSRAIERFDLGSDQRADRVLIAGGVVGIMGMQTLDACDRPRHSAARSRMGVGWEQFVPLRLIASVRRGQLGCKPRIDLAPCLHPSHLPPRLQPGDSLDRQRTGKPVASGKRRSVVEQWWNLDNYRQTEVTGGNHSRLGPQGAADLGRDLHELVS
jgi:hypothetical protein